MTYDMVGLHDSTKRASIAEDSVGSAAISLRILSTSSRKRSVKCLASMLSPSFSSSPNELAVVKGLEDRVSAREQCSRKVGHVQSRELRFNQ